MTKRILLIIFLVLGVCVRNFAQNKHSFSVKAGINFTGFHTGSSTYTGEFGVNAGILYEYRLSSFISLQPEMVFSQKGGEYKTPGNEWYVYATSKLNYIDIPLMVKIKILENINFQVGPQIGLLLSGKTEYEGKEIGTETNFLDFAVNGGFGFDVFQKFFIQTRYSYGLSELFKDKNYKNSVISLSVGYKFMR
ncbi:porin family protein [Autumnicola musiva]|uniref:Porin family protein n=1 Tax=Autumnicola musiva TaxID=3075589 RepID=A0ABU3D9S8_9FLAO|nr:porin family protein [Zunongwangia sp. F117]MDT0678109.1 porin family protein [Zunongwangia sp. F117]